MSLFENVFGPSRDSQWVSSHAPTIGLTGGDGVTRWLVVHNISEVIEEEGVLFIIMASGNQYRYSGTGNIEVIRNKLVKIGVIQ